MSPGLATALYRGKIRDRNGTYLPAAVIDALKLDPNNYIIRRVAIRRGRISARSKILDQVREYLQTAPSLVVHWDEKMHFDLTGQASVDRLPVLIYGVGIILYLISYSQFI